MSENLNVVESTAESIIGYNSDLTIDIMEIGLDSFLDDSILKEIPLIKTAVSIAKISFAIREKHMLKKTIIFINKLNNNGLSSEEYNKYKEELKIIMKNI